MNLASIEKCHQTPDALGEFSIGGIFYDGEFFMTENFLLARIFHGGDFLWVDFLREGISRRRTLPGVET